MKTILKYPLQVTDTQTIALPRAAFVLDVQVQRDDLVIWALVDKTEPPVAQTFRIFGTGHPCDVRDSDIYLATVQTQGGALVWHVFLKCDYKPVEEIAGHILTGKTP